MKYFLTISEMAEDDLASIMDYIAMDSHLRAEAYVDELLDAIRTLSHMPKRCPIAPESRGKSYELRHLIHGSYRVLFLTKGKEVIITRIIHGARTAFDVGHA